MVSMASSPLDSTDWLEWLIECRETVTFMWTGLLKDKMRDTDEQPDEKASKVRPGGCKVQKLLGPWSWPGLPSQYVDVFTNLEALWILYFGNLDGGFLTQIWSIINSISSPPPFTREWGGVKYGWKFQASNHSLVFPVISPYQGAQLESPH